MNENTKHKLAVVVLFILAMILGGSASASGQLEGLFAGILFTCVAYITVTKWFPAEVEE